MQNQKSKKENDFLKKTSKLPQKQPAKEKSLDTQWTEPSLTIVKTDGYTEGHARHPLVHSVQTPV